MARSGYDQRGRGGQCGRPSTRLHTRKTADVDGLCGRVSTLLRKPAETLSVDVWTVRTPYKGDGGVHTPTARLPSGGAVMTRSSRTAGVVGFDPTNGSDGAISLCDPGDRRWPG